MRRSWSASASYFAAGKFRPVFLRRWIATRSYARAASSSLSNVPTYIGRWLSW